MKNIIVSPGENSVNAESNYSLKCLVKKLIFFSLGLFISRGSVLGSYYPFGMSFFAVASSYEFLPAAAGVILGYLLPLRLGSGMRYISTVISIMAIKWSLNDLNKIKNSVLYIPSVVFFSLFTTGLAMNCADGVNFHNIMITLLECLISASASYFFDISFKIFSNKKFYNLDSKELLAVVVSLSIPLISFSSVTFHGISLGRILGILITLVASYTLNIIGGAIVGSTAGIIFSLSSFGMGYTSASYAFSGMIAGRFSSFGKWGVCMAFMFTHALVSFRSADAFQMITGLYETIIAVILFLILPKSFINCFKNIFSSISYYNKEETSQELIHRIKLISDSFTSSINSLDKISLEMNSKINLEEACFDSVKVYCSNCGTRKLCWENNRKFTYNNIREIIRKVSCQENTENFDISPKILNSCFKSESIIKRIYDVQKDFSNYKLLKSQTQEFKNITKNHFEEINSLLNGITIDLKKQYQFNSKISSQIKEMLLKNGIKSKNVDCLKSEEKRIFIKIEVDIIDKNKFDSGLMKKISSLTGRNFEKPILNILGSSCLIELFEVTNYKVDFAISQHACNGGKFCGDSYRCFENGEGKFNAILSDGMGTGSSAAVEGTIVSELIKNFIKSGLDFNAAIKLVNSTMLLNTKEETLTALDLLSIDLYKGEATFIKAGSPATFIIKDKNVEKINFSSLPIGILKNVSSSYETKKINPNDIILMFSDGVTDIGEEWIMNLIKDIKLENVSEISKYIVSEAVKVRSAGRDDDITAIAIKIFEKY